MGIEYKGTHIDDVLSSLPRPDTPTTPLLRRFAAHAMAAFSLDRHTLSAGEVEYWLGEIERVRPYYQRQDNTHDDYKHPAFSVIERVGERLKYLQQTEKSNPKINRKLFDRAVYLVQRVPRSNPPNYQT